MKYSVQSVDNYQAYTVLTLQPAQGSGLWFEPGQYVTISADGLIATPTRCFSIISGPQDAHLQLAFRVEGAMTKTISRLRIGDSVSVQGPFGDFVLDASTRPLVMLASGIGVTPFISMLKQLVANDSRRQILILCTNRTKASTPFMDEISNLVAQLANAQAVFFVGDDAEGAVQGRITETTLQKVIDNVGRDAQYYICGPAVFDKGIQWNLRDLGVRDSDVHSEAFSQSSPSPNRNILATKVAIGSAFGFATLAGLIAGIDMIATHNKAEAAYAAAHPSTQSLTPTSSSTDGASSPTTVPTTDPTPSTNTQTYTQPTQTYSTPSTNYYYSPPTTHAS